MSLIYLTLAAVVASIVMVPALYFVSRRLEKREPYRSFMKLRNRDKLRFFRLLVLDPRVPRRIRILPLLLVPYLALPFDLIPDFIPILGYVDDVAIVLGVLALVIRYTSRPVIDDLLSKLTPGQTG